MYDQTLFLRTVSEFTAQLVRPYEAEVVLEELVARMVDMLGLAGAGVALADAGQLQFATAVPSEIAELERMQVKRQLGPCAEAFRTSTVLAIADLTTEWERWPDYCATADRLGIQAVAGIPMQLNAVAVGALNLYVSERRAWPKEDLAVAQVMADMATGYLINASVLRQQEQLNEQLRAALESRAVIEQAKGSVAATHQIPIEEAFERIRSYARSRSATVRSVAEAIVHLGLPI